MGLICLRYFGS